MGQKKKLHITIDNNGQTSKRSFEVAAVIVGRSPECFIQLSHPDISRKHLSIYVKENEVWVEDMGSSNGSFLNSIPLKPMNPQKIRATDELVLGKNTGIALFAHLDSGESVSEQSEETPPEVETPKAKIPQSVSIPEGATPDMSKVGTPDGRQKVLRTAQEEAAEIVRAARKEAELEVQSIFERAQKTQKDAEDFYRKRLQEAAQDAEELRSSTHKECDSLLAKTRQTCDEIRKQVDLSVTELRTKTREECDKMYEDMEAQIKQVKEHRIREMEEGITHKETEILEDARNRMAIAEKDLQKSIASTQRIHEEKLKSELEAHQEYISASEKEHRETLEREKSEHERALTEEREAQEKRISLELQEHAKRLEEELAQHNSELESEKEQQRKELSAELELHNKKIESELQEHIARIQSERESHEAKLSQELEQHNQRITRESEELEERIKRETLAFEKQSQQEMSNVRERIERELDEHEKEMESRRKELEKEFQTLTHRNQDLEEKVRNLNSEARSLSETVSTLKSKQEGAESLLEETEKSNRKIKEESTALEKNIRDQSQALKELKREYEVLHNSHQSLLDRRKQAQSDFESDVVKLKSRLQEEKDRHIKEEKEHLVYLKQETTKKVQQVERELLLEISRKKSSFVKEILLSLEKTSGVVGKSLPEWRSEISTLEKAILDQVEGHLFSMQIEGSVVTEKSSIAKHKRKEKFQNIAYGCALGVALVLGITFGIEKLEGPSPLERAVASEVEARKKDLEERKFDPPKSRELKDTYVDAVIYTEGYVDLTTSEDYQNKWSLALAKHMLKLWKVDEDSSIQVASISNALVKTLQERKESIHPDYIQDGLSKMKELESEAVKRMTSILGSQVRYESLKKFEKDFFNKYRSEKSE